jgi:hypothetical protein
MGFGLNTLSSDILVPNPPANSIVFIVFQSSGEKPLRFFIAVRINQPDASITV